MEMMTAPNHLGMGFTVFFFKYLRFVFRRFIFTAVSKRIIFLKKRLRDAAVAQLVEHVLGKDGVIGSIPISS